MRIAPAGDGPAFAIGSGPSRNKEYARVLDLDGSLDHLTHSASFPAWVAVGAAAFFGLVFLLSLVRAERTVANGALAALTFAGLAIAAALGMRSTPEMALPERFSTASFAGPAALACIDDLAGETTLAACEKALFSAPDTVAAAVAYTAGRINRLVALSGAGNSDRPVTPDQRALRNAIERDRYGLVAYVLATRDKCQPTQCAAYAAITDHKQIAANMDGLIYEGLVAKYAPEWDANATGEPSTASGKPSSIDFPSAGSIPPVSIMTPEPTRGLSQRADQSDGPSASPPEATGGPYVPVKSGGPKKRSAAKRAQRPAQAASGPVEIAPSLLSRQ